MSDRGTPAIKGVASRAIEAKFAALGGPKGFLGPARNFIVEHPGYIYHVEYTHGSIYWDKTHGAHVIYGEIYRKWLALGGYNSVGYPITDEADTPDKVGRFNNFSNNDAAIYWTPKDGAHIMYGGIARKWKALGGYSFLGYPLTDEADTPDKAGRFNNFSTNSAAIYWTPKDGAHVMYGEISRKWSSLGGYSAVGYPLTDEASTPDNLCRFNNFSRNDAAIYWTPQDGAHVMYGAISRKWSSLGGYPVLGHPLTDESPSGALGGRYSDFSRGSIYWSPHSGDAIEHVGPLPDTLGPDCFYRPPQTSPDGGIWMEETASCSTHVQLWRNGNVRWWGWFHADGWPSYNLFATTVVTDADGVQYVFGAQGFVGGSSSTRDATFEWDDRSNREGVKVNWRALVARTEVVATARADGATFTELLGALGDALPTVVKIAGTVGPWIAAAL